MAEILTDNWHLYPPLPRLSCISEGLNDKFREYQKKRDQHLLVVSGSSAVSVVNIHVVALFT